MSVKEIAIKRKLLTPQEADEIFNIEVMTKPGIMGEEIMRQKKEREEQE